MCTYMRVYVCEICMNMLCVYICYANVVIYIYMCLYCQTAWLISLSNYHIGANVMNAFHFVTVDVLHVHMYT